MSAPASEMVREIARELEVAGEQGQTMSVAALRDHFELGHDDLLEALDALREHGQAVEAAPGEWRGPMADELPQPEPPRVRVSVADEEPPEREPLPRGTLLSSSGATVRLTPGVADALNAEALGAIVKAGIEEAKALGEPFVLEVSG